MVREVNCVVGKKNFRSILSTDPFQVFHVFQWFAEQLADWGLKWPCLHLGMAVCTCDGLGDKMLARCCAPLSGQKTDPLISVFQSCVSWSTMILPWFYHDSTMILPWFYHAHYQRHLEQKPADILAHFHDPCAAQRQALPWPSLCSTADCPGGAWTAGSPDRLLPALVWNLKRTHLRHFEANSCRSWTDSHGVAATEAVRSLGQAKCCSVIAWKRGGGCKSVGKEMLRRSEQEEVPSIILSSRNFLTVVDAGTYEQTGLRLPQKLCYTWVEQFGSSLGHPLLVESTNGRTQELWGHLWLDWQGAYLSLLLLQAGSALPEREQDRSGRLAHLRILRRKSATGGNQPLSAW